eukprot:scaffold11000_cov159-Ochromonas_danica.AAC.1
MEHWKADQMVDQKAGRKACLLDLYCNVVYCACLIKRKDKWLTWCQSKGTCSYPGVRDSIGGTKDCNLTRRLARRLAGWNI